MKTTLKILGMAAGLLAAIPTAGVGAEISDAEKTAEALDGAVVIRSQDGVAFVPVVPVTSSVPWRTSPVRIDGDLEEWKSGSAPVTLEGEQYATWRKGTYGGADDLSASVWLARDENYLYLAMEMTDDQMPAPGRIELAVAAADSPLITTWRDVGQRYGAEDVHLVFGIEPGGEIKTIWTHKPRRLAAEAINHAFGSEEERREFVEQRSDPAKNPKVFSRSSVTQTDVGPVMAFEVALPWRLLGPYDPVSHAPLKFNLAVHDTDEQGGGVLAWTPGLVGTYSAAHFPTLTFDPPADEATVQTWAALPAHHFVNRNLDFNFSFHNPGSEPLTGTLGVYATPGDPNTPLATTELELPPGYSQTQVAIHSEKVGQTAAAFTGKLVLGGAEPINVVVRTPGVDDSITILPVAVMEEAIAGLEKNTAVLAGLYEQIESKGLDTAYPLAYLTLHEMFIERSRGDMRGGDSDRVLGNTAHLEKLFAQYKAYMERVLADAATQKIVPPRFDPAELVIKDGYFHDGDRPVFLWGPCLFWYMRGDQPYAWKLGFNSAGPGDLPIHDPKQLPAITDYLKRFQDNGILVNAAIGSSQFDEMKKQHPEIANVDGNNFLSIIIQHPLVREEIKQRIEKDIAIYRMFPAVRSYWLWNEPAYSNFSEMTRIDYIEQYLKPRYQTIDALNASWNSEYDSFDQIQLTRSLDPENHAPWYDFQTFQNDLLADFFGFLHETSQEIDPTRATHVKYMAISLAAFDIERLQSLGDISGHDGNCGYRDILFLDFCRSLYPDKPISNTEIHIWYHNKPMVERVAWLLALHGLADGNWWCWHSNARFSNTVGSAESMEALTISGLDIQRLFDPYMVALNRKPKTIATLFPDVIAGRSGDTINALRQQWGPAQYSLGIQPHYATESRIAEGELAGIELLLAGTSDLVTDATYQAVIDYVKGGGRVIVTPKSFARNELGIARDTSELVKPEAGEPFADRARVYPLGDGQVVCVDDAVEEAKPDAPKPLSQRTIYRRVLDSATKAFNLNDPVAILPADASDNGERSDALDGLDWRSTAVEGGYALCIIPADYYDGTHSWNVRLQTKIPVRRIVDLVNQTEVDPAEFGLIQGPNLFLIELAEE